MFYCGECMKKSEYPESMHKSYGVCELCGKTATCNDISSKFLSMHIQNASLLRRRKQLLDDITKLIIQYENPTGKNEITVVGAELTFNIDTPYEKTYSFNGESFVEDDSKKG